MKSEKKMIAIVCDQTHARKPPDGQEVLIRGPEIAWAYDRLAADMYVTRHNVAKPGDGAYRKLLVVDVMAEFVTLDDGREVRIHDREPITSSAERFAAKMAVLARMTPEERALFD